MKCIYIHIFLYLLHYYIGRLFVRSVVHCQLFKSNLPLFYMLINFMRQNRFLNAPNSLEQIKKVHNGIQTTMEVLLLQRFQVSPVVHVKLNYTSMLLYTFVLLMLLYCSVDAGFFSDYIWHFYTSLMLECFELVFIYILDSTVVLAKKLHRQKLTKNILRAKKCSKTYTQSQWTQLT